MISESPFRTNTTVNVWHVGLTAVIEQTYTTTAVIEQTYTTTAVIEQTCTINSGHHATCTVIVDTVFNKQEQRFQKTL